MEPNPQPENPPRPKYAPILKAATSAAILLLIAGAVFAARNAAENSEATHAQPAALPPPNSHVLNADTKIEAKAAYVYDVKTGEVLFQKDPDEILPLASLTKIMMAYTARERYAATTTVTISRLDLQEDGDNGLYADERWDLGTLLRFTLIESSNDGASAIAGEGSTTTAAEPVQKSDFIAAMNANAAKFGFDGMRFYNESGLDVDASTSGGYGSAKQLSMLFARAFQKYPDTFGATTGATDRFVSESGITHKAQNTNTSVDAIPGMIASKTGYTDIAGGNLSIIFDADIGHPVIVTVLGSSVDGRFADVVSLARAVMATYAPKQPAQAQQ